jgi:hypothetical protein
MRVIGFVGNSFCQFLVRREYGSRNKIRFKIWLVGMNANRRSSGKVGYKYMFEMQVIRS